LRTLKPRQEVKGECTLLIAGCEEKEGIDSDIIKSEIKEALKNRVRAFSEVVREISQKYGLPKNKVYELALKMKRQKSEGRMQ
jgi:16S rRNA (cytidine1402-2'-O)-methyltransferase